MSNSNSILIKEAESKLSRLSPLRIIEFMEIFNYLGDTVPTILGMADISKLVEINMWLGSVLAQTNKSISPAVDIVSMERYEQLHKHSKSIGFDVVNNSEGQLSDAASFLSSYGNDSPYTDEDFKDNIPDDWEEGAWLKMCGKDYGSRCVISASLLIAEVDRLLFEEDSERLAKDGGE